MEIHGRRLYLSEAVDGDYVQILFEDESSEGSIRRHTEKSYLLLQRGFEIPGPYYLECQNHDLWGFGEIKRLALRKDGITIELNRATVGLSERTIRVYYQFTAEELVEVKQMLKTITGGYRCFVDETLLN
jgi:hypothetical protein